MKYSNELLFNSMKIINNIFLKQITIIEVSFLKSIVIIRLSLPLFCIGKLWLKKKNLFNYSYPVLVSSNTFAISFQFMILFERNFPYSNWNKGPKKWAKILLVEHQNHLFKLIYKANLTFDRRHIIFLVQIV